MCVELFLNCQKTAMKKKMVFFMRGRKKILIFPLIPYRILIFNTGTLKFMPKNGKRYKKKVLGAEIICSWRKIIPVGTYFLRPINLLIELCT